GGHAPAQGLEPEPTSASEQEQKLAPRPWRWPLYAVALALVATSGMVGVRLLRRPPPSPPQPARVDPLTTAQELLLRRRVDDALALLQAERKRRNSPALHRLLSEVYEAKDNRLRALGHMYLALRLSGQGPEEAATRLSLAQLLSRMGHAGESCRVVAGLTSAATPQPLRQQAESLIRTLRCEAPR
ncbi:MAG: hypothetical protein NZ890_10355, partial [Myxococcota bacterium]|nr:hypothetical protein [Myxococcota bacterium]